MSKLGAHAAAARGAMLGASMPPLLVAAERVAATVAQGLHGRRRVGTGENFWQFRPFVQGDARGAIDWRQSARGERVFVRETEWDAAQTVCLWAEGGDSMRWRSAEGLEEKWDRAGLLLLALASLLVRGGERVRLMDAAGTMAAAQNEAGLPRLAGALERHRGAGLPALPPGHGRAVLFGDFLGGAEGLASCLARMAALPVQGAVVWVLDPAELELPYEGRVRFAPGAAESGVVVGSVAGVRAAYQARVAALGEALEACCRAAGFAFIRHRTDAPALPTLLALYQALCRR